MDTHPFAHYIWPTTLLPSTKLFKQAVAAYDRSNDRPIWHRLCQRIETVWLWAKDDSVDKRIKRSRGQEFERLYTALLLAIQTGTLPELGPDLLDPTDPLKFKLVWRGPVYCACVLVFNSDGLVLSVSRKHDPEDKGLPGGKQEPGETLQQCAARELQEETGLILDPSDLEDIFSADGDTGQAVITSARCTTFLARKPPSGRIQTLESGVVEWVPLERLARGTFALYNQALINVLNASVSI